MPHLLTAEEHKPTDLDGRADSHRRSRSKKARHANRYGLRRRLSSALIPAGVLTAALFLGMQHLIAVDDIALDTRAPATLTSITPMLASEEVNREVRSPVKKLQAITPPPPPMIRAMSAGELGFEVPVLTGAVPGDDFLRHARPMTFGPVDVIDTQARPIAPPKLIYPIAASRIGLEGNCDVRFDVSVSGVPMNVTATCSDRAFVHEAERAVSRVQFAPKIVRGQRVARKNVIYPLEWRMD